MPWRTRGDRRYYYRSVRTPNGPRSVYVGTGPAAEAIAEADEQRRLERRQLQQALADQQAETEQTVKPVVDLSANVELLARAALLAAGFHHHSRSEWRRRRHARDERSGR